MVGLIPLFAVHVMYAANVAGLKRFTEQMRRFREHRPDLFKNVALETPDEDASALLSILNGDRLKSVLRRMLDPGEFLSDYGVRALSRYYLRHPYAFRAGGQELTVKYLPAESDNRMFGENSNWRGPIWFPVNYMIVYSLREFSRYHGDAFKVEHPTGSGRYCSLKDVTDDLGRRLCNIFIRNSDGKRAVVGNNQYFQSDPHWRDHIPFFEYFDGDTGEGLGASHQTGWTALIASLLYEKGRQGEETSGVGAGRVEQRGQQNS